MPAEVILRTELTALQVRQPYFHRPGQAGFCAECCLSRSTPLNSVPHPIHKQGLKFDLIVYSPYKSIDGFLEDVKEAAAELAAAPAGGGDGVAEAAAGLDPGMPALAPEQLEKARSGAYSAADALMLSDAPLLHTPGRLALAALRSGFSKVRWLAALGTVGAAGVSAR